MAEQFNLADAIDLKPSDITTSWLKKNLPRRGSGDAIGTRVLYDEMDGRPVGRVMQVGGRIYKYDPESFKIISDYLQASPQADLERDGLPDIDVKEQPQTDMSIKNVKPLKPVVDEADKAPLKTLRESAPKTEPVPEPKVPIMEPSSKAIESPMLNIEGEFTPEQELENQLGAAIRSGDTDSAMKVIDTILGRQDVVNRFRRDLTPEAMNADLLRAYDERRQGRSPSMTLTRTGEFGGEKRSPEEIERGGQQDVLAALRAFGQEQRAGVNARIQMDEIARRIEKDKAEILALSQSLRQKGISFNRAMSDANFKRKYDRISLQLSQATKLYESIPLNDRAAIQEQFKNINSMTTNLINELKALE